MYPASGKIIQDKRHYGDAYPRRPAEIPNPAPGQQRYHGEFEKHDAAGRVSMR